MEKCVEYVCPIIMLLIITILKLSVDNKVKIERIKRIIVEISVDIMSLAISFVISYLIALVNSNVEDLANCLAKGFVCFSLYIFFLILTVLVSKYFIRLYAEKEKVIYLIFGIIIGYSISISCVYYSISLIQSLGGV